MNFYEKFIALCDEKDVAPSRACADAKLTKSLPVKWKKNPATIPNGETLAKLCRYFHVSPSFFLIDSQRAPSDGSDVLDKLVHNYGLLTDSEKAQVDDFVEFLLSKQGQ